MRRAPAGRTLTFSLLVLGSVILFACLGLAFDGNWPKLLRVSSAFTVYAVALVLVGPRPIGFVLAGALAGAASGLIRPETTLPLVLVSIAGGSVFGLIHHLGMERLRVS
ncbi:MAG TPA: hypothetical protein VF039_01910 [Longimicrobiales bacterium]